MTRAERLSQVTALAQLGMTHRQIAENLGVAHSTVRHVLYDPDGSKQKARRERYRKPCPLCGKKMDGSGGYKTKSRYCSDCSIELQRRPITHGSLTGYHRGCRCRPCRDANAAQMRDYYRKNPHRRWDYRTREQKQAHSLVHSAVRSGDLIPPNHCENCGARERGTARGSRWLHAHHEDYAAPLAVTFLCPPCHKAKHRAARLGSVLSA